MLRLKLIITGLIGLIIALVTGIFGTKRNKLEQHHKRLEKQAELYEQEEQRLRAKVETLDEKLQEIDREIETELERRPPGDAAQYLRDWYRRTGRGPGGG